MKQQIFAVFDSKIGNFAQPFFMATVPAAKRAFMAVCSEAGSMLYKHPEDYSLFHLGEFDDETGHVLSLVPVNLGLASSYIRQE